MTKNSAFKKLVRNRMLKTGEKYSAARKAMLDSLAKKSSNNRIWVSMPDLSEETLIAETGRDYNEWCNLIEAWHGNQDDHAAVAKHISSTYEVGEWWAQGITVGYERITGKRLPYQRSDGSFAASKSKTFKVGREFLYNLLTSIDDLEDLFPGKKPELLSKPNGRTIRLKMSEGEVSLWLKEAGQEKTKLSLEHVGIQTAEEVQRWKFFWNEWCEAINESYLESIVRQ